MWHAGEPKDGVLWVEINWKERPVNAVSRDTLNELSELIGRPLRLGDQRRRLQERQVGQLHRRCGRYRVPKAPLSG